MLNLYSLEAQYGKYKVKKQVKHFMIDHILVSAKFEMENSLLEFKKRFMRLKRSPQMEASNKKVYIKSSWIYL